LAGHPDSQTLRGIHAWLMDSRERIQLRLSAEHLSNYSRWNLGHLLAATEQAIRRIDAQLAIDSGIPEPLPGSAGMLGISEQTLIAAWHLEPQLPLRLSEGATLKIKEALRLSALGGIQVHETIMTVRDALERDGVENAGALAENIFRNETLARSALASQARWNSSSISGMEKEWWADANCPIEAHRDLDGLRAPINGTFDVGGERMMFPHDPSASRENTERCTCTAVALYPGWEKFASGRQRGT